MKKFKFSLEKLLSYKEQILQSQMQKLSVILAAIQEKELEIGRLSNEIKNTKKELEEKMKVSITPLECQRYDNYIEKLKNDRERAEEELVRLNMEREKQIDVIAEAKKEHRSLEILKENKYREYLEEDRKKTEQEVEEFIMAKDSLEKNQ